MRTKTLADMGLALGGTFLIVAAFAGCGSGQGKSASSDEESTAFDGDAVMRGWLRDIKKEEGPADSYREVRELKRLESLLAEDRSISWERADTMTTAATLRMRQGDFVTAIEYLKGANAIAEKVKDEMPPEMYTSIQFLLGVANLRLAEIQNCIENHNEDSCIFPIRGGGIHLRKESSRNAIAAFEVLLNRVPDHDAARWLLNIAK
ncbi:MAG: hypothetical protein AAF989_11610, partial [Planctomycetota bacterium]